MTVFMADRSIIDQRLESLARPDAWRRANTLSTEAPTVFGGNFDESVENPFNAL